MIIILMGVSGAGKTTVGQLLASQLGWEFADADDYHSAANIEKMRTGIPLTDADRAPWLQTLRALIAEWIAARKNAATGMFGVEARIPRKPATLPRSAARLPERNSISATTAPSRPPRTLHDRTNARQPIGSTGRTRSRRGGRC